MSDTAVLNALIDMLAVIGFIVILLSAVAGLERFFHG